MKKHIVLVDMDNVIANQRGGFYRVLKERHPEIALPPIDSQKFFDIERSFPAERHELVLSLRLERGFFESLDMMPGAREGLQRLAVHHDVRIVTAPTWKWRHCVPEKYAWVEKHLGREWVGRMILTRDKTLVRGDILIDDAPEVKGIAQPEWEHVLYDQPYNQNLPQRRLTWETAFDVVGALRI